MVRAVLVDGDMLHARQSATTPFARALAASYCGQSARPEVFAPYDAALICAVGGRVDDAMMALERAAGEYAEEVVFAGVEPLFAALAGQPRFERSHQPPRPSLMCRSFPLAWRRIYQRPDRASPRRD